MMAPELNHSLDTKVYCSLTAQVAGVALEKLIALERSSPEFLAQTRTSELPLTAFRPTDCL
jgi:hypothetical protein